MRTKEVIDYFGGNASKLARACGTSPQAVAKWGKIVPTLRQYQLEVITRGELKSDFSKERLEQEGK